MDEVIKQSELRNDNAAIMRRVAGGESFVVTVNGRPVADLTPHRPPGPRRRSLPAALMGALVAETPLDVDAWQRDVAAADQMFSGDEVSDPWERPAGGPR